MRITEFIKRKQLAVPFWLTFLGTVCFSVMVWLYRSNGVIGLDETVIGWAALIRRAWLTRVFRAVTLLGSATVIITIDLVITGLGVWKKYNGRDILLWNFSNICGVTLMHLLKMLFARQRPPLPWLGPADGFSFPSGHTLMATVFYGFFLLLSVSNNIIQSKNNWLKTILTCLPVLIGLSRVYLGVHYASDVLAGWAAGIAWIGLWMLIRNGKLYS